jgi:hypothetical protein
MITRLGKHRYLRVAGFAVGAVIVASAAVFITASASGMNFGYKPVASTQPQNAAETASINQAANASTVCSAFMKHLAADLNKSQADVDKAIQKAIGETLTDEVNNKDITQAQADAIKQKLGTQSACNLVAGIGKPKHGDKGHLGAYTQAYLSASASVLGLTDAQLKTNMSSGQTLKQMAAAHKPSPISEADFRTGVIAKLKPQLDAAVTNKQLTSAQEQAIIDRLKTGALPLWDKPMHKTPTAPAA